jgi:hypothetical protein
MQKVTPKINQFFSQLHDLHIKYDLSLAHAGGCVDGIAKFLKILEESAQEKDTIDIVTIRAVAAKLVAEITLKSKNFEKHKEMLGTIAKLLSADRAKAVAAQAK